jgi:hypothetical protein
MARDWEVDAEEPERMGIVREIAWRLLTLHHKDTD